MIGDNKPNNLSKEIHGDHDLDEWYGTSWSPPLKQRFQLGAWKTVHILMEGTFKFIGLSRKGYQNALDLEDIQIHPFAHKARQHSPQNQ